MVVMLMEIVTVNPVIKEDCAINSAHLDTEKLGKADGIIRCVADLIITRMKEFARVSPDTNCFHQS